MVEEQVGGGQPDPRTARRWRESHWEAWRLGVERGRRDAAVREQTSPPPDRMLRVGEVTARAGLSRATLWRLERVGAFPRRVQISLNAVAWREREVLAWMRDRPTRGAA